MKTIVDNWEFFLMGFYLLEKIVKKTPFKWDDILFDMIIDPVFRNFKKEHGLKGEIDVTAGKTEHS